MRTRCNFCHSFYEIKHRTDKGLYCSIACQQGLRYQTVTIPRILRGEVKERATLKKYLIKVRGYACESCKGTEWQGQPIPLELDHIEGDASKNKPEDIRLLCPNCHALTPTWKNRNKGKGRAARGLALN